MADPNPDLKPVYVAPPKPKQPAGTPTATPSTTTDKSKPLTAPVAKTRMAPRLAWSGPPPIPHVYDPRLDKIRKVAKVAKVKPKTIAFRSKAPIDDQFHGTVEFSPAYGPDAGRTWAAQIIVNPTTIVRASPEGDKPWYWRILLEQSRVDPLLQGFELLWIPPPGWPFIDGLGATTWDEAINNPVKITRVVHSPANPTNEIGFLIKIVKKYQP